MGRSNANGVLKETSAHQRSPQLAAKPPKQSPKESLYMPQQNDRFTSKTTLGRGEGLDGILANRAGGGTSSKTEDSHREVCMPSKLRH